MTQGTPWKANWLMLEHEVKTLFSPEWRSARVMHKFLNIWVELIRAEPKKTVFTILVLLFLVGGQTCKIASAEGLVYSSTKPIGCDNPTTRTDGTPFDWVTEGDKVEVYFFETPDPIGQPEHTHLFSAGCPPTDIEFNLSVLTEGQKYQSAKAFDTEGRVNGFSNIVPFVFQKPPPSPPVVR